jgi:acetolactate decarboxylase
MKQILFILLVCGIHTAHTQVRVAGAMRNVMKQGDLTPHISLDSMQHIKNLYGIGPLDRLTGEIMIYEGHSYVAASRGESDMQVLENFEVQAPFFVYAMVDQWDEIAIPSNVKDLPTLENYLITLGKDVFTFRIEGTFTTAQVHIQNLPEGTTIQSPQDAHTGQMDFSLKQMSFRAVGFYSTSHKGVFTHHDSNIHIHLITKDSEFMGHLDQLDFRNTELRLWVSQ